MKTRLVMKKSFEYFLLGIFFLALLIGASDSDSTFIFIVTHLSALVVMVGVALMFLLYGRD